jgi:hypothetical protein
MSSQPLFVMMSTVDTTNIGETRLGSFHPDGIEIDALEQIIHKRGSKEAMRYFNQITLGRPADQIAAGTRKVFSL